uniref:Glycosyl transferase family 2 n=1 Tax=Rubrivivax gelatinosus S1 TaxID=1138313 RepID=L8BA81_RUBGE|nr:Glycosyl transferase family 2 [Rubrivivax gelatinosus S1]
MSPAYTVALCTHNHADRLERTLADLAHLRAPERPWEFLVIDNGSRDATPALLAGHAWPPGWTVRIVREERLGLSNARNRAIAEARGEYLIFMDDDETADPEWLRAFERLIATRCPDAFGGRIRVLFEDERPRWLRDELLGFLGELNRADTIAPLADPHASFFGGNFGFRLTVCERVGGFDSMLGRKGSDNTGGEEVDFYRRLLAAGLSVWWTPEAVIYHRIQAVKLDRRYFLDLHYRMGRMEAIRERGDGSRLPPRYLFGQWVRAKTAALKQRLSEGADATVRKDMNVAYFKGRILGWAFGPRAGAH